MAHFTLDDRLAGLLRAPTSSDDKYSRGVVGFITGSEQYPGAAILGVKAALATSIGMVKYVGPQRVQDLLLVTSPEVVCSDTSTDAGRASCWVMGSGVSDFDNAQQRNAELVFFRSGSLAVVDAGALEFLDFEQLGSQSLLLTPHYGELARLLNRLTGERTQNSDSIRENAATLARETAEKLGQHVLLKGSITYLASPTGEVRAIGPNSPHLATAGTGDILAGLVGAIAAANSENVDWLDVAELSVKLHSASADSAAASGAVSASTVLAQLEQICRKLAQ